MSLRYRNFLMVRQERKSGMNYRNFSYLFCSALLIGLFLFLPGGALDSSASAAEAKNQLDPAHPAGPAQQGHGTGAKADVQEELGKLLPYWTVAPFVLILLAIALLPLFTSHWWESNLNKGVISTLCSLPILAYLVWIGPLGMEVLAETLQDYYGFIILLVALFTISGGIHLEGDLKATPLVNSIFLGLGAILASFIGTTGAAMVLIRPLLNTNRERKFKKHIFVFFIFLVANIGGSLLPVGDPPLFLGYLFGVPFFWTLRLWPLWLTEVAIVLGIFYIWDTRAYSKESPADIRRDIRQQKKLKVHGLVNVILILGVLGSVVLLSDYPVGP